MERARQLGAFGQGRLVETVGEQAPQGLVHTVVPPAQSRPLGSARSRPRVRHGGSCVARNYRRWP